LILRRKNWTNYRKPYPGAMLEGGEGQDIKFIGIQRFRGEVAGSGLLCDPLCFIVNPCVATIPAISKRTTKGWIKKDGFEIG